MIENLKENSKAIVIFAIGILSLTNFVKTNAENIIDNNIGEKTVLSEYADGLTADEIIDNLNSYKNTLIQNNYSGYLLDLTNSTLTLISYQTDELIAQSIYIDYLNKIKKNKEI